MSSMRYFEDYEIGRETLTPGRTITETDVVNFAGITGYWYELHGNREAAARNMFGQRIAHGALIFSVSTGLLIRAHPPGDTLLAFYGVERLRFVKPVFIGDTIHVKQKVDSKRERDDQAVSSLFSWKWSTRRAWWC